MARFEEAVASYDAAIWLRPDDAAAYYSRGNALRELKQLDEALSSYDRAVALKGDYAEAYSNRANVLKELRRFEEALASYEIAIAIRPNVAQLHGNRGNALQDIGRLDEAIASYDRAIALKPDYAEAHGNRGVALNGLGRFEEALASYDYALTLRPNYVEARFNRSLTHLLRADFALGWQDYEARKTKRDPVGNRKFDRPVWLGDSPLSGKRILVHWEQGLGDTIQFCRYLRLLETTGAEILFAPQAPLKMLMRTLETTAKVVDLEDPSLEFDVHCPLMSLPLALRVDAISSNANYLSCDREKVAIWSRRLGEKTKPRIGLAWSGAITHNNDRNRSIQFDAFRPLLDRNCEFFSLQKDVRDTDKTSLAAANIVCLGEEIADFTDTAALCALMDLVISVDTSVAHLAGALGASVWVLLPVVPDWRWLLAREDSVWYRSMRLFRQQSRGDWGSVLSQAAQQLAEFTSSTGPVTVSHSR